MNTFADKRKQDKISLNSLGLLIIDGSISTCSLLIICFYVLYIFNIIDHKIKGKLMEIFSKIGVMLQVLESATS